MLLRIGLHTGLRQKNLRELLVCNRGSMPTSELRLEDTKRGELVWSSRDHGWEILIPSVAFKNSNSSFFGSKPFRLILPDLGELYEKIEAYVDRHRAPDRPRCRSGNLLRQNREDDQYQCGLRPKHVL